MGNTGTQRAGVFLRPPRRAPLSTRPPLPPHLEDYDL